MSSPRSVRLAIIGSGPAGYTAAIYAARALLAPVLIAGLSPGGQLTITTDVENYPGFAETVQGPWLMDQMRAQAIHVGAEMIDDIVTSADLSARPFRLVLDGGEVILAETVIIATGAEAKWLGLPTEQAYRGYGVSACATCDGFFYRGRKVAVVGGGNTAVEEALFLTAFAEKVTLVHRRGELKAERILQERLFAHPKIEVVWHAEVLEVVGQDNPRGVSGIKVRDVGTGAERLIEVEGVFIAIGHAPASELFAGQLPTHLGGYLSVTPGTASTGVTGVFACGDVTDAVYRQAVTAAGMGCMAALEAARLLAEEDHERSKTPLEPGVVETLGAW
jgi:thioredoxin reductase (NADPH)